MNPPVIDEESGARRSALTEASQLVARMAEAGDASRSGSRGRAAPPSCWPSSPAASSTRSCASKVKAYRAGYLAEDRRELERQLANDELIAVASTNALELGIDIGSLDAAVLVGYPGTRASMWQQAGRAGRRSGGSLAVLVAQDDPLDQYLVTHPADLFDKPPEAAVIDPTNPFVLEPHLACAAREYPLSDEEVDAFWPGAEGRARAARRRAASSRAGGTSGITRDARCRTARVDLRSTGGHTFSIVIEETGELLGTVDESRAYSQVHPGAVYLHQGEQFEVRELDLTGHAALVARSDPDYYTQARDTTDIRVESVDEEGVTSGGVPAFYGTVHVTNQVVAFARKQVATGEILDVTPLALPAADARDEGGVVGDPAGDDRPRGDQGERAARRGARGRARRDRAAAARRDVRPLGRRRRLDGVPPGHGLVRDLRLRRLPGRRGDHRARLPRPRSDGSRRRSRPSGTARARTAAPRASSRRSAATATSRSTRLAR